MSNTGNRNGGYPSGKDASNDVDLTKLYFLVIDDNRFARTTIRECMAYYGMKNVMEAEDGASGLKVLSSSSAIDCVIVDIRMPIFDGIEFSKMVRGDDRKNKSEIPIIVVTGHGDEKNVKDAMTAGVNGFLVKPFSAETLYKRISKIINDPLPFIRLKNYIGPDRRVISTGPRNGQEDQRAEASKD